MKFTQTFHPIVLASYAMAIPLSDGNSNHNLSALSIIDQAVSALGGTTTLGELKGITYHAPG
jgi:hypothetical protein